MSGPVLVWEHLAAGFVAAARRPARAGERQLRRRRLRRAAARLQPLERPLRRPARRGAAAGDPGQLRVVQPRLRARPCSSAPGSMCPTTWARVLRHGRGRSSSGPDGRVRGFGQRGTGAWHTMYTGFATQFWSYGGADFEDGRCALASPASRPGDRRLPRRAPRRRPDRTGSTSAGTSSRSTSPAGGTALLVDSDHYVAYFEDPATSELVGEIGYAPPPVGPDRRAAAEPLDLVGRHEHAAPRDRDAAWRFVEWATGSEFLLRSAFEGNMNPTRSSIWDDERFRAHTSRLGRVLRRRARRLIERDASCSSRPAANYLEIASAGSRRCSTPTAVAPRVEDALVCRGRRYRCDDLTTERERLRSSGA